MSNAEDDHWLEGGVDPLTMGAENGFLQEVDRIIELLGTDEHWLAWWQTTSQAPALEVHIIVLKPRFDPVEERVVRGRKRHLVQMLFDFHQLEVLEPDERRLLALPAVLEGISRARQALKLAGDPPPVPEYVRPAPLSASTLRRRRLRDLRGETNAPLPNALIASGDASRLRPVQARATPTADSPTTALPHPVDDDLVVEIHIPLGNRRGDEFGWIDDIEDFLDDESSDGSFDLDDLSTSFVDVHVFFLAGASEDVLLAVAANVAALPGVPAGAFAVVTDIHSEEMGSGRRVSLS